MKSVKVILCLFLMTLCLGSMAQEKTEFKPSGQVSGKVFFNYSYDMTDGEEKESGFDIERAYLGYNYNIAKDLKASITLDVGKNDGGSDYTAYLKKAQLEWKASSVVKVTLGMISTVQFSEQEKFWGYRYLLKSFNDQYGFGSSADLGIKANFKLNDAFSANAFIINGEGYKELQDDDGNQRYGASLIYKHNGLIAKVYADATSGKVIAEDGGEKDVTTSIVATFLAYKFSDKFKLAAEYNKLVNGAKYSTVAEDKDLIGLSFYSTYTFNKKWEVFGRYDYLSSNKLEGAIEEWNMVKNGDAITSGIQYAAAKGVKVAFNYRNFNYKDSSKDDQSQFFVNFEFKF